MNRQASRRVFTAAIALFVTLGVAVPGLSAQEASPPAGGDRFTPEEVLAATGSHGVVPLYAVPKHLKKKYLLAFLNPGKSVPFFQDWSDAMKAAAAFYGVDFIETDLQLKYEDTVTQYETISVRNPDVVGTLTTAGPALKALTDAAGIPLIPIDIPIEGDPYFLGIPNEKAGELGGQLVAAAALEKLNGDWKGRNLVYVGLGAPTCEPCTTRVQKGLEAARKVLTIPDENVVMLDTQGQVDPALTVVTDTLTARPNDVMIMVALNDECGVGALQAVKAANRQKDVLIVTLGADRLGRDNLRADTDGVLVSEVDFNPWAEGWNWVEAAIATAEGETYKPYDITRVVTRENVDQFFPDDKTT
jgi:ABC-type sugar transport system substrate-binding protein